MRVAGLLAIFFVLVSKTAAADNLAFDQLPPAVREAIFSVAVQAQRHANEQGVAPDGVPVGQFREEAAKCAFVLNHEAARNTDQDEIASLYYMAGGAYAIAAPQGKSDLLKHMVLFVQIFGDRFGVSGSAVDEPYIEKLVSDCESSLNKYREFFNAFGSKYQVPPNLAFRRAASGNR